MKAGQRKQKYEEQIFSSPGNIETDENKQVNK